MSMHPQEVDTQKPSHEEWLYWTDVVIERLSTCVKTYARPPHDIVLLEKEQAEKKEATLNLLRRIYALIDSADTPTESLTEVAYHDERVMQGLAVMMREVLDMLPTLSADMQKLLKSPWQRNCNGQTAETLFCGPKGKLAEGIGSGHAGHGRLPAILQSLLERERIGDTRQPRQELHREVHHHQPTRHAAASPAHAGQRRWADRARWQTSGAVE